MKTHKITGGVRASRFFSAYPVHLSIHRSVYEQIHPFCAALPSGRLLHDIDIYALLGILCVFPVSVYYRGRSAALFSLCIAWLYAVSDELHQYFVPGRSCEIRDVLIDWSGAALGVGIVMLIGLLSKRKKQK